MDLSFDKGKPFLPFEQLLAVLPVASKDCLPVPLQWLMFAQESPIIDFYPVDIKLYVCVPYCYFYVPVKKTRKCRRMRLAVLCSFRSQLDALYPTVQPISLGSDWRLGAPLGQSASRHSIRCR